MVFVDLDIVFEDRIIANGACYRRLIGPEMMIAFCLIKDSGYSARWMRTAHEKHLWPG